MGEKGNVTSDELASAAGAAGAARALDELQGVAGDVGSTLKDTIIDKGADAGIAAAQEKYRSTQGNESADEG